MVSECDGRADRKNLTGDRFFLGTWLAARRGQLPGSGVCLTMHVCGLSEERLKEQTGNTVCFPIFHNKDYYVLLTFVSKHTINIMIEQKAICSFI